MKQSLAIVLLVLFCMGCLCLGCLAEENNSLEPKGIVAKVTTRKGTLNLRSKPSAKGRVIIQVPNGTCLLVVEESEDWSLCSWNGKQGYCTTEFLTFLRDADPALLNYRVLRKGDRGEDVLALKTRLQELGYIRRGSVLTSVYNDILAERISLFQRQVGLTEDGIASQELQAFAFSEKAPQCTQSLPRVRSQVKNDDNGLTREICGCCMGDGCGCCGYTGWIYY